MKLPANWKTTVSGVGAALFAALTTLAALPYTLGDVATVIPPEWKAFIFKLGLVATVALKVWNSLAQKDKNVTGGTVQQTISGAKAVEGTQSLVDATVAATAQSGERIPSEFRPDPLVINQILTKAP